MPEEVWPIVTFGGKDYYQVDSVTLIDIDPDGLTYFLVGTPQGGIGAVGPLIMGDPGKHTEFQTGPQDFTPLAWDDPTAASLSIVEVTPGSDTVSQVVKLAAALHEGAPGADGTTSLDLGSVDGTAAAKKIPVLNSAADGLEWQTQKVGDRYYPASYNDVASGNPTATLGQRVVGPFDVDVRIEVQGQAIITPTSSDVAVDLLARLNNATTGNVIGRGLGVANQSSTHNLGTGVLAADATAGGADYDKVAAGATVTIYFRAERTAGSGTFTSQASRTWFWVKANPIP